MSFAPVPGLDGPGLALMAGAAAVASLVRGFPLFLPRRLGLAPIIPGAASDPLRPGQRHRRRYVQARARAGSIAGLPI